MSAPKFYNQERIVFTKDDASNSVKKKLNFSSIFESNSDLNQLNQSSDSFLSDQTLSIFRAQNQNKNQISMEPNQIEFFGLGSNPISKMDACTDAFGGQNIQKSHFQNPFLCDFKQKLVEKINGSSSEKKKTMKDEIKLQQSRQLIFYENEKQIYRTPKKICLEPQKQDRIETEEPFDIFDGQLLNPEEEIENVEKKIPLPNYPDRLKLVYQVLQTVGEGHTGKVLLCKKNFCDEIHAVKYQNLPQKQRVEQTETFNEIKRLLQIQSTTNSDYIIKLFDHWIDGNQIYLSLEYCESSIQLIQNEKFLKNQGFSEMEIFKILHDVLEGLVKIHQNKLVHLDIKTENILFSKKQQCFKIADFGLCRSSILRPGEFFAEGDRRYCAPELLNIDNDGSDDLSSADIYSLGISLYDIMTSNIPENRNRQQNLQTQISALKKQQYSESLSNIIIQMIDPEPSKRPTASQILKNYYFVDGICNQKWQSILQILLRNQYEALVNLKTKANNSKLFQNQ